LIELFGRHGEEIYDKIRGIDNRKIEVDRERKSLGTETTFSKDTKDKEILKSYIHDFSLELSSSLKDKGIQGRTITVKVKYHDFTTKTRSRTLLYNTNEQEEIYEWGLRLLDEFDLHRKLRLIGLTVSNLTSDEYRQLSFIES